MMRSGNMMPLLHQCSTRKDSDNLTVSPHYKTTSKVAKSESELTLNYANKPWFIDQFDESCETQSNESMYEVRC